MAMGMLVVPTETAALNASTALGSKIAQPHANRHGQEDPQGQVAVQKGQPFGYACVFHEINSPSR